MKILIFCAACIVAYEPNRESCGCEEKSTLEHAWCDTNYTHFVGYVEVKKTCGRSAKQERCQAKLVKAYRVAPGKEKFANNIFITIQLNYTSSCPVELSDYLFGDAGIIIGGIVSENTLYVDYCHRRTWKSLKDAKKSELQKIGGDCSYYLDEQKNIEGGHSSTIYGGEGSLMEKSCNVCDKNPDMKKWCEVDFAAAVKLQSFQSSELKVSSPSKHTYFNVSTTQVYQVSKKLAKLPQEKTVMLWLKVNENCTIKILGREIIVVKGFILKTLSQTPVINVTTCSRRSKLESKKILDNLECKTSRYRQAVVTTV